MGSKTEAALLSFAKDNGWADYARVRAEADVLQMVPFSSARKAMGVVVRRKDGTARLYLKGAGEILTKTCMRHVVIRRASEPETGGKEEEDGEVDTREMAELDRDNISRTIVFYANQTLRTIVFYYRYLGHRPPEGVNDADEVRNFLFS